MAAKGASPERVGLCESTLGCLGAAAGAVLLLLPGAVPALLLVDPGHGNLALQTLLHHFQPRQGGASMPPALKINIQ